MKGFSLRSLRVRLILIVVIAAVPALGLILYNTLEQRKHSIHEAQEDTLRLARIAVHLHEEIIEDTRLILTTLAQVPEVRVLNQKKCNTLMADLLKKYSYFANLGVAGLDGHTACNAIDPKSRAYAGDRNWFKGAIKKKDFSIGEYIVGWITNKAVLVCGYPVLDSSGKVQSVIFAAIDLTWFNRLAAETKMVKGSTLTVLDRDGTILTRHPDPAQWIGKKIPDSPLLKTILTKHEGLTEAPGLDGAMRIYAFLPLKGIPVGEAFVKVGIPKDHILSSVHRNLVRNLIVLGLIFITVLFLAWMGGNLFVLRQVNTLIQATKRLSAGDLSARLEPRHRTGEFDQLAHAFDRMAESLEKQEMERQEADEALRKSEEKYHNLIDTMSEGLGVQDKNGLITFMNKRACEMLGYKLEELIGKSIYFVFNEENQKIIREQMGGRRKGERQSYEVSWLRKDGGKIETIISPCPVFDEKGNLEASVAVFTDITERKRAEEELQKYRDRLEDLVKERTAELEKKIAEIERLNRLFVGRELRMVELKEKIKELEGR